MVVSSDSIKNATAINHGSSRLLESGSGDGGEGGGGGDASPLKPGSITFVGLVGIGMGHRRDPWAFLEPTTFHDDAFLHGRLFFDAMKP
jgi:hypothetical protein